MYRLLKVVIKVRERMQWMILEGPEFENLQKVSYTVDMVLSGKNCLEAFFLLSEAIAEKHYTLYWLASTLEFHLVLARVKVLPPIHFTSWDHICGWQLYDGGRCVKYYLQSQAWFNTSWSNLNMLNITLFSKQKVPQNCTRQPPSTTFFHFLIL